MNFCRSAAGKLQVEEELGAVLVLPLARVHRAAAQSHDERQMLDADRTLELAPAAGGALERRLFGNELAQQGRFVARPALAQVGAQTQHDFLGIERLAGVVRGAVLGAAAALHAGVRLQCVDPGDVLAGVETEILVAHQRRDAAEARAAQEHGGRAEHQVQVLGVRDERKKCRQRERVGPPVGMARGAPLVQHQARQVGHHQEENEKRDQPRLLRHLGAQPDRADEETADEQAGDGDGHQQCENGHQAEIPPAEHGCGRKERTKQSGGDVVHGDQCETAKAPEDEGVREAGQRPLPDDLPLQQYFPEELAGTGSERVYVKIGSGTGAADDVHHLAEAYPEQRQRGAQHHQQQDPVDPGWMKHGVLPAW